MVRVILKFGISLLHLTENCPTQRRPTRLTFFNNFYLKSQCHPKCFARRGTFFIYEKYAIFLIVVKSDLYLLPSLPLAIRKH